MNTERIRELQALLDGGAGPAPVAATEAAESAEPPDTAAQRLAKKRYGELFAARLAILEMMDALSALPEDILAAAANAGLTKALRLFDDATATMRRMGLQKA